MFPSNHSISYSRDKPTTLGPISELVDLPFIICELLASSNFILLNDELTFFVQIKQCLTTR